MILYYLVWSTHARPAPGILVSQLECDFQSHLQGEGCSPGAAPASSLLHLLPHSEQGEGMFPVWVCCCFPCTVVSQKNQGQIVVFDQSNRDNYEQAGRNCLYITTQVFQSHVKTRKAGLSYAQNEIVTLELDGFCLCQSAPCLWLANNMARW